MGFSMLGINEEPEEYPEPAMAIAGFKGEYRWLSNFWPVEITYEGVVFPSTECAYQAAKTIDAEERRKIAAMTPGEAKKYSRRMKIRSNWVDVKLSIMEQLLRLKFAIPELRQKLIDTGDVYLEETNTWGDVYFGVYKGVGENHLGKLLMKIRSEINNVPQERSQEAQDKPQQGEKV